MAAMDRLREKAREIREECGVGTEQAKRIAMGEILRESIAAATSLDDLKRVMSAMVAAEWPARPGRAASPAGPLSGAAPSGEGCP